MMMRKRIVGKFAVFAGLCVSLSAFGQAAQEVPSRPAMQMPAPTRNDTLKSLGAAKLAANPAVKHLPVELAQLPL
jgi:hypothetical protein